MKKIQILGFQFKALAICGVWRPDDWISKPRLILYSVYSLLCCFLIISLTVLQLLLLVLTEIDFKILTETLFTMLTSFTVCVKMTTFLFRREEITSLMDMLSRSWCVPRNRKEDDIQKRSNDFIKWAIDDLYLHYRSIFFLIQFRIVAKCFEKFFVCIIYH